jgi:hypothetical protein
LRDNYADDFVILCVNKGQEASGLFSLQKNAGSSRTKDDDEDENESKLRNLG